MSALASNPPASPPAVIVFGLDDSGKPHASTFDLNEVALAEKAAGLMGMSVVAVTNDTERALAAKVPKGRVFASGKGFVPFIKAALFTELEALGKRRAANGEQPLSTPSPNTSGGAAAVSGEGNGSEPSSASADDGAEVAAQPSNWTDIRAGAIVLSAAAPKHTEWYECQVMKVDQTDRLTLRYCDWPKEPPFTRQRHEVALLHPSLKPEPPIDADEVAA